jgi:tRNA(Ile)-lysidine synthase TilS/MesJ
MRKKENDIYLKKIQNKVGKAINSYQLIQEGDNILVGLSGGVDSLVLLDIIYARLRHLPVRYDLQAIHVVMQDLPKHSNTEYLQQFCEYRNIPLHLETTTYQAAGKYLKFDCFPCSWNRRKVIFKKAGKLNCNKLAFGHHMDDTLETLLMNMVHHAEISAMPPKLNMQKGNFEIIRPLILCTEQEIKKYATILELQSAEGDCPYSDNSNREIFKEILAKINAIHAQAKINLFNSMDNIFDEYLPEKPS